VADQVEISGDRWSSEEDGADALLLIPGLGSNATAFDDLVPILRRRFEVLAVDNRGAGRSPVSPDPFTVADMAEDVLRVLDREGLDAAHILGTSMGGMIAQELAVRHPDRVRTLALVCTSCGGSHAVRSEPGVFGTFFKVTSSEPEHMAEVIGPILFSDDTPHADRVRFFERRAVHPTQPAGFLAQIQAVMENDTYDRLGAIRAPTLVLHGREDILIPPANADVLAGAIAGARAVVLPGAHVFFLEHPEPFLAELEPLWSNG
jgi:pimeloyl-ACP methyl ester carboxylesterase